VGQGVPGAVGDIAEVADRRRAYGQLAGHAASLGPAAVSG
jgi:hypothetical protein